MEVRQPHRDLAPGRALSILAIPLFMASSACNPPVARQPPRTVEPENAARAPTNGIRRTLIGRESAHESGWETRLYLIEYPPNTAAPAHIHPAVGVGWVIDGEFESAFGDEPVVSVHAGQGFVDKAAWLHRVFRNPSATRELRFVVAYTMRSSDEPFRLPP